MAVTDNSAQGFFFEGCAVRASETVGALREGGERETYSPLLAPRREQNLVTFLDLQAEHRLWVGREGRRTRTYRMAQGGRGWRVTDRSGGRAVQGGLAGGSMVWERGGRKASEANSSLTLPGAMAFPHRQPVLFMPHPHPGPGRSSSPSVSDLFIAQNQFGLWKGVLSFPGLVYWMCIAKLLNVRYWTLGPWPNHHLHTFQTQFVKK